MTKVWEDKMMPDDLNEATIIRPTKKGTSNSYILHIVIAHRIVTR